MRPWSLLPCLVLLSTVAHAEVFDLVLPARFALAPARPAADGELLVEASAAKAAHGLKRADRAEPFVPSMPLEPGARYVVRDGAGGVHWLFVASRPAGLSRVELTVAGQENEVRPAAELVGRYQNAVVRIEGLAAEPTFSDLELLQDGRYRLGSTVGRWTWKNGQLGLEGAWAHWGQATVDGDAGVVRFTFQRARWHFEVTFTRLELSAARIEAR